MPIASFQPCDSSSEMWLDYLKRFKTLLTAIIALFSYISFLPLIGKVLLRSICSEVDDPIMSNDAFLSNFHLLPEQNLRQLFQHLLLIPHDAERQGGESPVIEEVPVAFIISAPCVYRHHPHDDNATNSAADARTDPHSTALLCTFKDPLLLSHIMAPTSALVYNFVRTPDLPLLNRELLCAGHMQVFVIPVYFPLVCVNLVLPNLWQISVFLPSVIHLARLPLYFCGVIQ